MAGQNRPAEIPTRLGRVRVGCTAYGWEVITEGLVGVDGIIQVEGGVSYRPVCRRCEFECLPKMKYF